MLNRLVELSLRYKFLVLIVFAVIAFLVSELATLRIAAAERSKPVPVTT